MKELQHLLVYKNIGETPLEALERARTEKGISKDISMTYAGRLDPMAEGLLLILVGEECKQKEKYLNLNKEYEVEILFGFKTDTGDVLGKIIDSDINQQNPIKDDIEVKLSKFKTQFKQTYPKFSSKLLNKQNESFSKEVEIFEIAFLEEREISSQDLLLSIESKIEKVTGEFRQKEIISLWRDLLEGIDSSFKIVKIKVFCSSGTYMRVLAENIGKIWQLPALAYSIKRIKIESFDSN